MAISYNKQWRLLTDKDMNKKDLQITAGISSGVVSILGRDEDVTTTIFSKICKALNCDIGDIMERVNENKVQ